MPGTKKRAFPLGQVYGLLEPGPVVLVTTARAGRPNIMTLSWHTMMEFEPPIVGCVISIQNYSFEILKATGECVINLPTCLRWSWQKRWWVAETLPDARWTCSRPLASPQWPPRSSRPRSSPSAMLIWNAGSLIESWCHNTTSSSWRLSKRGLIRSRNICGR
jgi:hypothetical protein